STMPTSACTYYCSMPSAILLFFFFFQAEDGIRDLIVTGVQTCALPILIFGENRSQPWWGWTDTKIALEYLFWCGRISARRRASRSEERRVGKECRSRGSLEQKKKNMSRGREMTMGTHDCIA